MIKPLKHLPEILLLFIAAPLLSAVLMLNAPERWGGFFGDGAVYYAMADSLANDLDFLYTRTDLERIMRRWPGGPQGILLAADDRHPEIIHYAKPILYPLLGAPLVCILHENGLLLLNASAFLLILYLGFICFPDVNENRKRAVLWTLCFWGLTVVPAYIFTLTPDLFNAALVMAASAVWIHRRSSSGEIRISRLVISSALIGVAAAARPPNALFFSAPIYTLLLERPGRRVFPRPSLRKKVWVPAVIPIAFISGTGLILFLTHLSTGQWLSYGGFRKRIVGHMPFESPDFTFLNTGNMISTRTTRFVFHWDTLRHNCFYFFTGRFTGLIPYFLPAAVTILVWLIPQRQDRHARRQRLNPPMIFTSLGLILFHLIYIPTNYHGGSCAIGNRYLISFLPAIFLSLRRPPSMKLIYATLFITAMLSGAVALNPIDAMARYAHVPKRDVLNRFPPEITLLNSWPVDDARHVRVPFTGYFAYFADDNQWGKELNGFWVRGHARTTLVLRCWKRIPQFTMDIRNGGMKNTICGHLGTASFSLRMTPGEHRVFYVNPGKPVLFYNINGDPSFCYSMTISTTDGFIPKFCEPGNDDPRFLGCFVRISESENGKTKNADPV